ncbi:TonB-dependent receptor plug domain-containing protein [uncultured Sunxiuqinia sp.]|uniref:TonB-dependent receptor plug domain-containing protein n=1 Tax=uncultured Sunxiuqinia sp. TaxID=1573825 RepID=UPI002AA87236|nr:TonB-dependent receptor plug domain-containing protein [uncultured Sunxiuqinia sp.]
MAEDAIGIEEVVVVAIGYGTVKRANLTGAISTTDAKTFQSRPVQNAANALQGEIPGLTVIRTGGAPGSNPVLRIRDVSSIKRRFTIDID